jgi:hypothetical protein
MHVTKSGEPKILHESFCAEAFEFGRDALRAQHVVKRQGGRQIATLSGNRIVQLQKGHTPGFEAVTTRFQRITDRRS